jgi:hypothetical protein
MYSPKWGAYSAAYIAMRVLDKKPITDGMTIPKVGKVVMKGKVLTIHNVLLITKDNVDQFNF